MKKHVADLTGAELDYWAARAEGLAPHYYGDIQPFVGIPDPLGLGARYRWCPSTDWSQGGPIIEREHIGVVPLGNGWCAEIDGSDMSTGPDPEHLRFLGPTPLIAAMRTFVANRLGNTVEEHTP